MGSAYGQPMDFSLKYLVRCAYHHRENWTATCSCGQLLTWYASNFPLNIWPDLHVIVGRIEQGFALVGSLWYASNFSLKYLVRCACHHGENWTATCSCGQLVMSLKLLLQCLVIGPCYCRKKVLLFFFFFRLTWSFRHLISPRCTTTLWRYVQTPTWTVMSTRTSRWPSPTLSFLSQCLVYHCRTFNCCLT